MSVLPRVRQRGHTKAGGAWRADRAVEPDPTSGTVLGGGGWMTGCLPISLRRKRRLPVETHREHNSERVVWSQTQGC